MTYKELYKIRKNKVDKIKYEMLYFSKFDYSILKNVMYLTKQGRYKKTVNEINERKVEVELAQTVDNNPNNDKVNFK